MNSLDVFLMTLGGILLLGLVTSTIGERSALPRVTLLLLFGLALGPQGLALLPSLFTDNFDLIANVTLMMVGFLLGGKLHRNSLRDSAVVVLSISVVSAIFTSAIVAGGLVAVGVDLNLAILLGAIAAATAPAAVIDVIDECGFDNRFTRCLLAVVALDDVWALLIFAVSMAFVSNMQAANIDPFFVYHSLKEVVGSLVLGVSIGVPSAYLTGRIKKGQPMLLEALGIVCVCGGLAMWLNLSSLIATIALGATVSNLARHHERPFHAISDLEATLLVVFFMTAGASLEIQSLRELGLLGIVFIALRSLGKGLGAWTGASIARADASVTRWMPFALWPQAGVSIGMALVASSQFPQYRDVLVTVVISSTVVFEILGPVFTRWATHRASNHAIRNS